MLLTITSLILATATAPTAAAAASNATDLQAELVIGQAVANRQVEPLADPKGLQAGQTVYAWTEVKGPGGGYVEHIWYRDGKEVAHHYLPLGEAKRWRTWSRHKLSAGEYRVEVLAPDGKLLQESTFSVAAPSKS